MTSSQSSKSIAKSFTTLRDQIAPASGTLGTAKSRTAAIAARLQEEFTIVRKATVGSFLKKTAVRVYSDVDLFVAIRGDDLRWGGTMTSSNTVLDRVRECLRGRYRNTDIGRDDVAVTVRFERGEAPIDVVPGWYVAPLAGAHPIYNIPDGRGDWMPTSPDAQRRWFGEANRRAGGQLARVVQLIKWWASHNRSTPVPLSSFHLEIITGSNDIGVGPTRYSDAVAATFRLLVNQNGAAVEDPVGVSRPIALASTSAKVSAALVSLRRAADHATHAVDAERAGKFAEAHRQWSLVFSDFPA